MIGLIATGSQTPNEEKISKLAALTLANLNLAPSNRALIVPYEQELALIAASDEKTCKIIAEILGDLDSYQVYSKWLVLIKLQLFQEINVFNLN